MTLQYEIYLFFQSIRQRCDVTMRQYRSSSLALRETSKLVKVGNFLIIRLYNLFSIKISDLQYDVLLFKAKLTLLLSVYGDCVILEYVYQNDCYHFPVNLLIRERPHYCFIDELFGLLLFHLQKDS